MPRSEAVAVVVWGQGLEVGKLAVLETEHFDSTWVLWVTRTRIIAARHPVSYTHLDVYKRQAPHNDGYGFGPRHLDFSDRFTYVSLERENSICIYELTTDGTLSAEPLFLRSALVDAEAKAKYAGQASGPIHVHPSGRFVYQTNRGSGTLDYNGKNVWNGGENDIVVWRINPATGEPLSLIHI